VELYEIYTKARNVWPAMLVATNAKDWICGKLSQEGHAFRCGRVDGDVEEIIFLESEPKAWQALSSCARLVASKFGFEPEECPRLHRGAALISDWPMTIDGEFLLDPCPHCRGSRQLWSSPSGTPKYSDQDLLNVFGCATSLVM
jgi:hypothetical protein